MDDTDRNDTVVALVTGASSGIGYEYAVQLAGRGYHLVLVSNEREKLEQMGRDFSGKFGIRTWSYYMDLARPDAAQELYDYCKSTGLRVEILVNNAGFFFFGEVVETCSDRAAKKMLLHMVTPSLLCRLFGKEMKQMRKGYILNMSSISAWMPYPGIAFYAATKAYLKSFSRSLRSEMLDYNVSVTCVYPGATATNLFDRDKVDYRKAMRLGIMMRAERVARAGIRGMFRRKAVVVPGAINKIFVFLVCITPPGVIQFLKRNTRIIPTDD